MRPNFTLRWGRSMGPVLGIVAVCPIRHLTEGNAVDEVPSSSSKQTKETHEKVNSETMNSSINDAESANDVNSTKVAAMKAAELVNKNLEGFGGVGYLSTDQKKKLLWGNKKKSASEESSSCWDFHLFPNQECQENFNRLMNLRLPLWLLPICPSGQIGQACESSSKETETCGEKLGKLAFRVQEQFHVCLEATVILSDFNGKLTCLEHAAATVVFRV
ncbi:hypothetical protein MUK42_16596 [Musa troglodytarum]|uniref:Uncharacterized protein n=1 Tax=Musa troglodytarum TaxID=320322 RepID=A0A9E7HG70_9LILI|nr:hypothetical protein MUK42_16596 [Musa troglodytarum]